jgi:hypothetical protein
MEIRATLKRNWFRTIMIILITGLGIHSCQLRAQSHRTGIQHIGLEGGFGMRSFLVGSNIGQINKMQASHEGGNVGIVFGNKKVTYRLNAGYYVSSGNTPQTQELYEVAGKLNYYPLAAVLSSSKIHLYVTTGISLDKLKFYGNYLADQYSNNVYEPYLGSLNQISVTGGLGLEYRIPSPCDIIRIFAEAQVGTPVQMGASNNTFLKTTLNQFNQFSVGVSFGRNR